MAKPESNPVKQETTDPNVTIKLLINKKLNQVLYAEANKDFVDFLFSLIVLPLGSAIRLLSMEGGLSNLCKSVNNLNNNYIQPNQTKNVLLKPNSPSPFFSPDQVSLLPTEPVLSPPPVPDPTGPYKCVSCNNNLLSTCSRMCPYCGRMMSVDDTYALKSYAEGGGFVKGLVKYMVMDDLAVSPLSAVSNIGLLSKFDVKELGDLEERVVCIGSNEGLELLKQSLNSKTVLTDVFLGEAGVKDGNMKKRKSNATKVFPQPCVDESSSLALISHVSVP